MFLGLASKHSLQTNKPYKGILLEILLAILLGVLAPEMAFLVDCTVGPAPPFVYCKTLHEAHYVTTLSCACASLTDHRSEP